MPSSKTWEKVESRGHQNVRLCSSCVTLSKYWHKNNKTKRALSLLMKKANHSFKSPLHYASMSLQQAADKPPTLPSPPTIRMDTRTPNPWKPSWEVSLNYPLLISTILQSVRLSRYLGVKHYARTRCMDAKQWTLSLNCKCVVINFAQYILNKCKPRMEYSGFFLLAGGGRRMLLSCLTHSSVIWILSHLKYSDSKSF